MCMLYSNLTLTRWMLIIASVYLLLVAEFGRLRRATATSDPPPLLCLFTSFNADQRKTTVNM